MIVYVCPFCGSTNVFPKGSQYQPAILLVCADCGAEWLEEEALP